MYFCDVINSENCFSRQSCNSTLLLWHVKKVDGVNRKVWKYQLRTIWDVSFQMASAIISMFYSITLLVFILAADENSLVKKSHN